MRSKNEETAGGRLTPAYEPSIDELLNDPVAEAIMRYDQITRQDVYRVISKVTARRAAARNGLLLNTPGPAARDVKVERNLEADLAC